MSHDPNGGFSRLTRVNFLFSFKLVFLISSFNIEFIEN
jgi:hypothetical protein